MILSPRKVKLELARGNGRLVTRRIHDARPTGHTAKSWIGREYHQWIGWIKLFGDKLIVWGYTESANPPESWANDTY